jgi:hypothetical protein
MSSMTSSQPGDRTSVASPALQPDIQIRRTAPAVDSLPASAQLGPRRIGYGLPCAKCKTYYAADLSACPVCKTEERVLPTVVLSGTAVKEVAEPPTGVLPDDVALEEERERFLREFKAQVYASHTEISVGESFRCSEDEHHPGESEPATVCQGCYLRLQERVDLLEAALHMDLQEATQLIYDAVWSDPSDPSKTYHNAAHAVLTALRKRAGISAVMGPLQPLSH